VRATDFNTAVFAFGRMNPITIGHAKLIDMVKQQPGKHYLFLTHTQKPKTDPLTFDQKLAFAKDTFDNITVGDSSVKTIIQAMQKLESLGYVNVILVAGSDRVEQFKKLLNTYNGKDYNFKNIRVVSAGDRDPDSEGVEGASASLARHHAQKKDFESFKSIVPGDESKVKKIYKAVQQGMGITEVMGYATYNPKRTTIKRKVNPEDKLDTRSMQQKIADRRKELSKKYSSEPKDWRSLKWVEGMSEAVTGAKVYVDMDGVIADFFSALAKFRKVKHWKDDAEMSVEQSIKMIAGTDFFSTLPVFPTSRQLIDTVKAFTGGEWYICSSPLRGDHENSKNHKVSWLKDNNFDPAGIIITGRKESYAVDKATGSPNILIDDKPSNLDRWEAKGGIGIRYQANQDSVGKVAQALQFIKQTDLTSVAEINKAIETSSYSKVTEGDLIPFPDNTVVVDIDNKNDYYQLTKDMSSLDKADKKKYGKKGKPDTLITFQSKDIKNNVSKNIKKNTGMKVRDTKHSVLYNNPGKSKKVKVKEHGGRVVKGINTTIDVGPDAIKKQSAKLGFNVSKDGVPPRLKISQAILGEGLPFQNDDGKYSMLTLPGTKKWQQMKKTSKPGTEEWFKTWKSMPNLTKGRKNHYMLPVKEMLEFIQETKHSIKQLSNEDAKKLYNIVMEVSKDLS
tara:strand:- start:4622 stop:6649 length:2028 start_codon:yes stop_codon:yes gene_type:complete